MSVVKVRKGSQVCGKATQNAAACNGSARCTNLIAGSAPDRPRLNGSQQWATRTGICKYGHAAINAECMVPCVGVAEYECMCVSREYVNEEQFGHRVSISIPGGLLLGIGAFLLASFYGIVDKSPDEHSALLVMFFSACP